MEVQGNEWGPSRAWVCPAGSILRRSISRFISAQRDLPLLSGDAAVRAEKQAWLSSQSWSRPPGPSSCGTPPLPEAYPPACLLGQGLGDGVEVGFATEEPMKKDEGWTDCVPVQKLVGKPHRPGGRSKDARRF